MIVELKRKDVRNSMKKLEVSNKMLRDIQSCLRSELNDAAEEELVDLNPRTLEHRAGDVPIRKTM